MTAKDIQKRNQNAEQLNVLQSESGQYFVQSSEGKILYNVSISDDGDTCTCGDYAKQAKKDPNFKCKHVLAVYNAVPKKQIENAAFLDKSIAKLDDRFITNIKGKEFVLYAGVLDLATQMGLSTLEVELIQHPSKENGNEAICRAVAESKTGKLFSDIGDANPNNCASMIAKHLIRMASTRAKGRALRDMCNIGIACLEELSDFDDVIGSAKQPIKTPAKKKNATPAPKKEATKSNSKSTEKKEPKEPKPDDNADSKDTTSTPKNDTQPKMSVAQKKAIFNLSRRRGISVEELEKMSQDTYGLDVDNLSSKDASTFIRNLQQAA